MNHLSRIRVIWYPRSAGGRAFEKPLTLFEEYGFRPEAGGVLKLILIVLVKEAFYTKKAPDADHCGQFESLS